MFDQGRIFLPFYLVLTGHSPNLIIYLIKNLIIRIKIGYNHYFDFVLIFQLIALFFL